ncbi:hypothetical Protein YC6258_04807 [Gynuella sunshinyii YC6258]|uniref:Uncharacterized protein n=1 Tax=Gynuella sunshinyii YC6258 TaxID=1445510 RepID=A0A0C5W2E1_9GAMM|nr:hypothetical Protein YC6258_04807 [Gynuella sunshinyii YC6258]
MVCSIADPFYFNEQKRLNTGGLLLARINMPALYLPGKDC